MNTTKYIILGAIAACAGCSSVTVQTPDGLLVKRTSWIWSTTKLASFETSMDSNGVYRVKLRGYGQSNEESLTALMQAAAQGAVEGAVAGAKKK